MTLCRPKPFRRTLSFQAVLLIISSAWLFSVLVPLTVFHAKRSAKVTAYLDGIQLPSSVVQTVENALHITSVYRRIQYCRSFSSGCFHRANYNCFDSENRRSPSLVYVPFYCVCGRHVVHRFFSRGLSWAGTWRDSCPSNGSCFHRLQNQGRKRPTAILYTSIREESWIRNCHRLSRYSQESQCRGRFSSSQVTRLCRPYLEISFCTFSEPLIPYQPRFVSFPYPRNTNVVLSILYVCHFSFGHQHWFVPYILSRALLIWSSGMRLPFFFVIHLKFFWITLINSLLTCKRMMLWGSKLSWWFGWCLFM